MREEKYQWLESHNFQKDNYVEIAPESHYYFFVKRDISEIRKYPRWQRIDEIFPVNSVGIVTSRDNFVVAFEKRTENQNNVISDLSQPDEIILLNYKPKEN